MQTGGNDPVSRRIARMLNIAAEWRWVVILAVCVVAVTLVARVRRKRPNIASLPSSLLSRRRTAAPRNEEVQGPEGGRVVRLDGEAPSVPSGRAVGIEDHPFPPMGENGPPQPPPPPRPDEPIVTIDLTELEDESRAVEVTPESQLAALPADPWG